MPKHAEHRTPVPEAPIRDRFRLETPEDINRYNELNRRQIARNDADARTRADLAAVARQELSSLPRGATALAAVEAIRANQPDAATVALAKQIDDAERAAESHCERLLVDGDKRYEALHLAVPFLQELQKLAKDSRYCLASLHMVGADGEKPNTTTINPDSGHLLTSVVVHATSRPGVRWVLGPSKSFADVVKELWADVHCDFSEPPYARKLLPHKSIGKTDCIVELAEDAACQRSLHDSYEREMRVVDSRYRHKLSRPAPLSVGLLFPVAFSNEIVVLKFCAGHALALFAKYGIQTDQCDIEEPWESVGNYW